MRDGAAAPLDGRNWRLYLLAAARCRESDEQAVAFASDPQIALVVEADAFRLEPGRACQRQTGRLDLGRPQRPQPPLVERAEDILSTRKGVDG